LFCKHHLSHSFCHATYIGKLDKYVIDWIEYIWMADDVTTSSSTNRVGNFVDAARQSKAKAFPFDWVLNRKR
jgi:tRNA(Phe) wybutosine-synthesizing methylase Tyw3